ncbi:MAG TPA: ABC transporter ATP-binding protein, partial [Firmicutes bacterium]|nr:ABC transporter ATP-binding protein [Bacillota bacterium]
DILVLDEPTAVLTPQEVGEFFEVIRNLKKMGKSIVFISHKLKEVMAISDQVTVIRRGRIVGSVPTAETNVNELARLMVGRDVEFVVAKEPAKLGPELFRIDDLHVPDDRNLPAVDGVSLTVRAGEILGIAGVDGNGQNELAEAITGMRRATAGRITMAGRDITNLSSRQVFESKIVHIPADRHRHGLVLDFTVAENMVLRTYYRQPFSEKSVLHWDVIRKEAQGLIEEYDVRTPDEDTPTSSLSGGNQQKVIVARELSRQPDFIVAAQPTRGLDIGAIEFVHRQLIKARDTGKAVLLFSLELDEIMALADRIAVMYEGKIVGIVPREEATEEKLGLMMAGITDEESAPAGALGGEAG